MRVGAPVLRAQCPNWMVMSFAALCRAGESRIRVYWRFRMPWAAPHRLVQRDRAEWPTVRAALRERQARVAAGRQDRALLALKGPPSGTPRPSGDERAELLGDRVRLVFHAEVSRPRNDHPSGVGYQ